jgi:hypothetical protein
MKVVFLGDTSLLTRPMNKWWREVKNDYWF